MRRYYSLFIIGWIVSSLSVQSEFTGNIRNEMGEPISTIVSLQAKNSATISGFSLGCQGAYF